MFRGTGEKEKRITETITVPKRIEARDTKISTLQTFGRIYPWSSVVHRKFVFVNMDILYSKWTENSKENPRAPKD